MKLTAHFESPFQTPRHDVDVAYLTSRTHPRSPRGRAQGSSASGAATSLIPIPRKFPRLGAGSKKSELCLLFMTKSAQKWAPPPSRRGPREGCARQGVPRAAPGGAPHSLEWGGAPARPRDENLPREGGAGRGVLSSVCVSARKPGLSDKNPGFLLRKRANRIPFRVRLR